jgi:hypothetical protein
MHANIQIAINVCISKLLADWIDIAQKTSRCSFELAE